MQKNINHQQGKHLKINMEGWNKKMNVKINKSKINYSNLWWNVGEWILKIDIIDMCFSFF